MFVIVNMRQITDDIITAMIIYTNTNDSYSQQHVGICAYTHTVYTTMCHVWKHFEKHTC